MKPFIRSLSLAPGPARCASGACSASLLASSGVLQLVVEVGDLLLAALEEEGKLLLEIILSLPGRPVLLRLQDLDRQVDPILFVDLDDLCLDFLPNRKLWESSEMWIMAF
jgi:hypothetical protein